MLAWMQSHELLLGWLFTASVLTFVASLIAVPWLIVRIPADYFLRQHHYVDRWQPRHPLLRIAVLAAKNTLGAVLLLMGIIMLLTPGQGILTIFAGLLFLDFPGKFALERRVVAWPPVYQTANWMRAKTHRQPLELPRPSSDAD